jgi:hypothetical protein
MIKGNTASASGGSAGNSLSVQSTVINSFYSKELEITILNLFGFGVHARVMNMQNVVTSHY